ncbi:MAG: hypothetical protein LBV67_06215 [Streptococcaceae bacterium]|jgi:sarcosine oxidase delta subunit|nr:hypothetical protein [Streptococcaceae bacterium]
MIEIECPYCDEVFDEEITEYIYNLPNETQCPHCNEYMEYELEFVPYLEYVRGVNE